MSLLDQIYPGLNLGANSNQISNDEMNKVGEFVTKAYNTAFNPNSGLGGCGDFGTQNHNINNNDFDFDFHRGFTQHHMRRLERLYYTEWGAKKIVDIPVDDALREPFEFKGLDEDESKKINDYLARIDFYKKLEKTMKMERLYGGAALFIGTSEVEPDLAEPINYGAIEENDLVFFNPISRIFITQTDIETDPTQPGFCDPSNYTIHGKKVASNRLMIFDGAPFCRIGSSFIDSSFSGGNRNMFGYPILLRIEPDLMRATGARQAAFHLIQRASMLMFIGDLQTAAAFRDSTSNLTALKQVLNSMSNFQAALINSSPGGQADVKMLSANFSSIPELVRTFDATVASAAHIPITKYLGESPKGLSSSGEGELEDYNNTIRSLQRHRLAPQIVKRLMPILLPSVGIDKNPESIEIIFPALWSMTDLELSQIRTADMNNVTNAVNAGLITPEEGQEELLTRDTLNIEPAEPAMIDFDDDDGGDFDGNPDK